MRSRRLYSALVIVGLIYVAWGEWRLQHPSLDEVGSSDQLLAEAFENQTSNLQVKGRGTVIRVLPDDYVGSRHQRFILQLGSGQTLLVAHNIDLAERVLELTEGEVVSFYGEYEWKPKGGVIHWTHADPQGRHVGGWIRHNGKLYQ